MDKKNFDFWFDSIVEYVKEPYKKEQNLQHHEKIEELIKNLIEKKFGKGKKVEQEIVNTNSIKQNIYHVLQRDDNMLDMISGVYNAEPFVILMIHSFVECIIKLEEEISDLKSRIASLEP